MNSERRPANSPIIIQTYSEQSTVFLLGQLKRHQVVSRPAHLTSPTQCGCSSARRIARGCCSHAWRELFHRQRRGGPVLRQWPRKTGDPEAKWATSLVDAQMMNYRSNTVNDGNQRLYKSQFALRTSKMSGIVAFRKSGTTLSKASVCRPWNQHGLSAQRPLWGPPPEPRGGGNMAGRCPPAAPNSSLAKEGNHLVLFETGVRPGSILRRLGQARSNSHYLQHRRPFRLEPHLAGQPQRRPAIHAYRRPHECWCLHLVPKASAAHCREAHLLVAWRPSGAQSQEGPWVR